MELELEGWRGNLDSGGGGIESAARPRDPRTTAKDKIKQARHGSTRTGRYLGKRLYRLFFESFTIVLQLPSCPGKQGKLS